MLLARVLPIGCPPRIFVEAENETCYADRCSFHQHENEIITKEECR